MGATVIKALVDGSSDQRGHPRVDLGLPAIAVLDGQANNARLINITAAGAMIETSVLMTAGQKILLRCGAIQANASIIWAAEGRLGVQFDQMLSGRDLTGQLARCEAMEARKKSGLARREPTDKRKSDLA